MSAVTIRNVEFLNNPARFTDAYNFRVTFECISPLKDDLEWKLIYVPTPGSPEHDQELDDCMVGPVPVGINSFEFSSPAPDTRKIPSEDVLGVAAIILTATYNDQEFVRVGYYQNTEYDNEEWRLQPPSQIVFDRLTRELASKPKVTRFMIKWDADETPQQIPSGSGAPMVNSGAFGSMAAAPGSEFPRSSAFPPPNGSHNYAVTSSAVPPANSMVQ
ncbi:Histone chaperone asf1 [Tulasnella sp. JGI-2019a]|nr:Histone chaperone asf1 [Tulasnella sp. JGI-2019a]